MLCVRTDAIELGQQEGALCPIGMCFVFVHALGLYAAAYIRGIFLIPVQDLQSVLIIPLEYPQAVVDNGNLTRMDDRFADEAVELIQRQFPLQSLLPEVMGILIIFPNWRGYYIVCLEDGEDITENIGDGQNLINGLFHAASGGKEMAEVAAAYKIGRASCRERVSA